MSEPTRGELAKCRWCDKNIMFTDYNGRLRWCHLPILRVWCEPPREAEPLPVKVEWVQP